MTVASRPTARQGRSDSSAGTLWQPNLAVSALVGLVAMGLAVGTAELAAVLGTRWGWLSAASSPITSLGTTFIHLTPEWLKEYAIRTFGQHDKDALRIGMYLTLFVVALVIGGIARRSPRISAAATALLIVVTIGAIYSITAATPFDAIPILVGGTAGIYVLVTVFRRTVFLPLPRTAPAGKTPRPAGAGPVELDPSTSDRTLVDSRSGTFGDRHPMASATRGPVGAGMDRRGFFRITAIGAVVAVAAGAVSRWIPSTADVLASRAKIVLPVPTSAQSIPAGADLAIAGLTPYVTATNDFYRVDTAFVPPNVTAEEWGLRIHGLVDKPISIDYAELIARPQIQRNITLTCVSNPVGGNLAGNATWTGSRIDDLLAEAGPNGGADCVLCTSKDGFTVSAPLDALTDGRDAMLAVGMNGAVLPIAHGFPVRMVVPGLYGYVSATKWVVDMELTKFSEVSAYWTSRGWSDHGPIKTASRIDIPRESAQVPAGDVTVAGVAWAQHRGITAVEVRIDNGGWQPAELAGDASVDTWRQWKFTWRASSGNHTIACRATDGTGAVQTSAVADVAPDGATGYDARTVRVA